MIFAQVLTGVIVNVIVLSGPKAAKTFEKIDGKKVYDCVIRVDNVKPQPVIGWKSDCKDKFTPAGKD